MVLGNDGSFSNKICRYLLIVDRQVMFRFVRSEYGQVLGHDINAILVIIYSLDGLKVAQNNSKNDKKWKLKFVRIEHKDENDVPVNASIFRLWVTSGNEVHLSHRRFMNERFLRVDRFWLKYSFPRSPFTKKQTIVPVLMY